MSSQDNGQQPGGLSAESAAWLDKYWQTPEGREHMRRIEQRDADRTTAHPGQPRRRWQASPDRDNYRTLTTAAVMLVAAIAAVISFVHIESLAVRYGQPVLAAWLLPVSIDGTVAVASMAMLRAARLGLTVPWLARTMLLLAVAATLACNVAYGLPHGWPGALLSGWPAVAFVGSAEVAISMSRKRSPRPDKKADKAGGPAADKKPKRTQAKKRTTTRTVSGADTEAAILAAMSEHPDFTTGQLAEVAQVSDRTVRRVRSRLSGVGT